MSGGKERRINFLFLEKKYHLSPNPLAATISSKTSLLSSFRKGFFLFFVVFFGKILVVGVSFIPCVFAYSFNVLKL